MLLKCEFFTHFGSCFLKLHDFSTSHIETLDTGCFLSRKDKTRKDKKCGVIYEIPCDQDPAHVYIGETKRPLGKRFKEHINLTIPTGVGDHCNATGHSVSLDNTKVLTREPQWTKRKENEAIYIKKGAPSMNREQGYQLPPIYHQVLLPEQFPRKKTSRDQGFQLRGRNVVKFQETRSKVSEQFTFQYHEYWIQ